MGVQVSINSEMTIRLRGCYYIMFTPVIYQLSNDNFVNGFIPQSSSSKKVQSKFYFPKLCTKAFRSPYQTYSITLDHFKIPLAIHCKAEMQVILLMIPKLGIWSRCIETLSILIGIRAFSPPLKLNHLIHQYHQ